MGKVRTMPEDQQLPYLSAVVNASAVRERLQDHLPGFSQGEREIQRVIVSKIKYRPGRACEIIYRLKYADPKDGGSGVLQLAASLMPQPQAAAAYKQELARAHVTPAVGPAFHYDADWGMLFWGFPNDAEMPHLHKLLDESTLLSLFRAHFSEQPGHEGALNSVHTKVIKYVPRNRCTLKHTLQFDGTQRDVYSKIHRPKTDASQVFEVLEALWRSPVCRSGALRVPEPLFIDPELNAHFVGALDGAHVLDVISSLDLQIVARKSAVALAGIQQSGMPTASTRLRQDELEDFASTEADLLQFDPGLRERLHGLRTYLSERLSALPSSDAVPNHGAFRLPQLLWIDDGLGLIDFEGTKSGDHMLDVASFVTHLLYLVVKGESEFEDSLAAIHAFNTSYAAAWDGPFNNDILNWYCVATLVSKHAKKCVKLVKRNRETKIAHLLEYAHEIAAGNLNLTA